MKRLWLLLLVVLMALGVAGCTNNDEDPVGKWRVYYDYGCNGGRNSMYWYVQSDGTFVDDDYNRGSWTVDKKDITFYYNRGYNYFGSVDGDQMSGDFVRGSSGCWTAQRISTGF